MPSATKMLRVDVYDQLKDRLFAGELRSGQFVSQRELTALLGATLNPVREALRKLEAEGLINVYAQRGIQIVEAKPKAINDAYDYRVLLETNAVRHFVAQARPEQVQRMIQNVETALATLKKSPADQAVRLRVLDADYQFHKDLIDFQGNEIISKHYSLNAARLRLFRVNIGEPLQRLDLAAKEHLEILAACRQGDGNAAVARLAAHIQISREHTLGIRPVRYHDSAA
ncbi:MAG: GntR family transcriptional regulator [Alphaproteobacteria bacterium]|nr:GntR family transcriptional regulator [Alphaproteobacteria bacterium]